MKSVLRNKYLNRDAWDVVPRERWFIIHVHDLPRGAITYDVEGDRCLFPADKVIMVGPFKLEIKTVQEGLIHG